MDGSLTPLLVRKLLENPLVHEWSLQGFGMLRLSLSEEVRMHIWDSRFRVKNVSAIHDHPWDFDSVVVAGSLMNTRFHECDADSTLFNKAMIKCGAGGCLMEPPRQVRLASQGWETYLPGETYHQAAEEIHSTMASDGAITIITRKFRPTNRDFATLYFEGDWVTAEPRKATPAEVLMIVGNALSVLNGIKKSSA